MAAPEWEMTNMQTFAVTCHEMFNALVDAGFDEDAALEFVVRYTSRLTASGEETKDDGSVSG